jgi:uncharacterized protein YfdQ (DUF2303 family)
MEEPRIIVSPNAIPEHAEGIAAVIELAKQAHGFQLVNVSTEGLGDGLPALVPVAVDLKGSQARITGVKDVIEQYRTGPERRTGTAVVTTLASFIELVKYHKDESSAIFAETSWPKPKLTAVLDYHQIDKTARRGKHRVNYSFPVTPELQAWIGQDAKPMEQGEFAAFLEDHAAELAAASPEETTLFEGLFKEKMAAPNDLISLARSLEIFVNAKVKNAPRLSSGERVVQFSEEHVNSQGEKVEIPGIFIISVQPFIDGNTVRIPARLRYRIVGGSVKWFYQLYRWDFALRDQVKADLDHASKETGLPAYEGAPEA